MWSDAAGSAASASSPLAHLVSAATRDGSVFLEISRDFSRVLENLFFASPRNSPRARDELRGRVNVGSYRQVGAAVSSLGRPKVDVLSERARDINPGLALKTFPDGIAEDNLDDFLDGVDLYVDSLDFFALDIRRKVFAACARNGIPATTAAPIGMGVALLNFMPGGMTFENYFQFEGQDENEQMLRFLLGLSPAMLHAPYVVDDTRIDLERQKVPSTGMACELCAGVVGTQAVKILLRRGKVITAPRGMHFDAYRNKMVITWRPGGNRNPLQRLGLHFGRKRFSAQMKT